MASVRIPLLDRARKYGYIMWRKKNDFEMQSLLGHNKEKIEVLIDGSSIGVKNIDWKNRRIPITYSITRALPEETSSIALRVDSKKRLCVSFS
jgi:hypothetical protein